MSTTPRPSSNSTTETELSLIENACIAKTTKTRYNHSNVQFIEWIYHNHNEFLRPQLKEQLDSVQDVCPKKKKRRMVQIIREGWLLKMERSRPELCPVIMSEIQYEHIAEYMSQKKTKEGKYFSKTTYESIRSAFMHLFIMSDMTPPLVFVIN